MPLLSAQCPVCQSIVGRDKDGTLHEHGEVVDGKFVFCVMSGRKPRLEPVERQKKDA